MPTFRDSSALSSRRCSEKSNKLILERSREIHTYFGGPLILFWVPRAPISKRLVFQLNATVQKAGGGTSHVRPQIFKSLLSVKLSEKCGGDPIPSFFETIISVKGGCLKGSGDGPRGPHVCRSLIFKSSLSVKLSEKYENLIRRFFETVISAKRTCSKTHADLKSSLSAKLSEKYGNPVSGFFGKANCRIPHEPRARSHSRFL